MSNDIHDQVRDDPSEAPYGVAAYQTYLDALARPGQGHAAAAMRFFNPTALINICHPFNAIQGVDAYLDRYVTSLQQSFESLHRRDDIVMWGKSHGMDWVSSTGYLAGNFVKDWLGILADGELAFIRFGEFHRMQNDRAVESYVILDIPELMIARKQWPIQSSPGLTRGYAGRVPGPATGDGRIGAPLEAGEGQKSLRLVTDMLHSLSTPDEAWRPYWDGSMAYYGPAAFGSFLGLEGFSSFELAFKAAFDEFTSGSVYNDRTQDYAAFGAGSYACIGGWPSVSGILVTPFLDQAPTRRPHYIRCASWWRRDSGRLMETWTLMDVPDLLKQIGYDLFGKLGSDLR